MKIFSSIVVIVALVGASNLKAQENRVTVTAGDHAKNAESFSTVLDVECKNAHYKLRINKKSRSIRLERNGRDSEVRASELDSTLLSAELFGNFKAGCYDDRASILFVGYRLGKDGDATPVKYTVEVRPDGTVVSGLVERVDVNFLNLYK